MEPITAAIFDMDGTILDSSPMWAQVSPRLLRQLGVEPKESIFHDMLPLGMREFAPFLKQDYSLPQPVEELAAAIEDMVRGY